MPPSAVSKFLAARSKEIVVKLTAHRNNAAHRIRVTAAKVFNFKEVSFGSTTFMTGAGLSIYVF